MLCDLCMALFRGELSEVDDLGTLVMEYTTKCRLGSLEESCPLCFRLKGRIRWECGDTVEGEEATEAGNRSIKRFEDVECDLIRHVEVYPPGGLGGYYNAALIFEATCGKKSRVLIFGLKTLDEGIVLDKNNDWCTDTVHSAPSDSTKSPKALALACTWFSDCKLNHSLCNALTYSTKLPTRLLQICPRGPTHTSLIETSTLGSNPPYMTLSHCWGAAPFLKLTAINYSSFLSQGIPLVELPQTFRDALEITAFFGVRYLWIDSLCIIQGSPDDWSREASLMADVYANSLLNIASSASSNPHEGLFRYREPIHSTPCAVTTDYTNWPSRDLVMIEEWPLDDFREGGTPLLNRGWVVQERFLAPRVLHFGPHYLYWECKTLECSERYPLSSMWKKVGMKPQNTQDGGTRDLWRQWRLLVEEYSKCELTKQSDKLIAFSGIARNFGLQFGIDNYCAGLWRQTLLNDLLWRIVHAQEQNVPTPHRPACYRAPTWSWASVNGHIIHSWDFSSLPVARVVSISITPHRGDYFGEVTGGELQIAGYLMEATIFCDNPEGTEIIVIKYQEEGNENQIMSTNGEEDKIKAKRGNFRGLLHFLFYPDVHTFTTAPLPLGSVKPLSGRPLNSQLGYFLPLNKVEFGDRIMVDGLVLKCSSLRLGAFERIGLGRQILFSHEENYQELMAWTKAWKFEKIWGAVEENGRRIITII